MCCIHRSSYGNIKVQTENSDSQEERSFVSVLFNDYKALELLEQNACIPLVAYLQGPIVLGVESGCKNKGLA